MENAILEAEIRSLILKNDKQLKHIKELRKTLVQNQEFVFIGDGMKIQDAKFRAMIMYSRSFDQADEELNSNRGSE